MSLSKNRIPSSLAIFRYPKFLETRWWPVEMFGKWPNDPTRWNCWNCWNWAQDWCLRSFPVIGLWTLMTKTWKTGKGNALFCQADEFRGKPWSRLPGEFLYIFVDSFRSFDFLIFFWSKRRGWVFLSFQHLLQGASRAWDLVEISVKLDQWTMSSFQAWGTSWAVL